MLKSLFCCFKGDRGLDGERASPHGPSPLPMYAEACRGPQEEGAGGGRIPTFLRAKHSADLEEPKSAYINLSQSLQGQKARFKDDRQPATTSGQVEIPESQRKQFQPGNNIKSKPVGEVIDLVRSFDFDDGRIKAVRAVVSILGKFTAAEMIDLVRSFDFDDNGVKALQAMESEQEHII
ncbi:hypothetical protein VN97_g11218 [Penicillium thymicola]|uniref:DUF4476 domain-containing protein n=1 Tax=Penicillium thymicola TaxID=293382 RepID=A0AAI9X3K2_PENTH|nr:hypothetical protein VN97_g11218 [Penicillium thymicola]